MTWFLRENNILSLNVVSLSALPFSVCFTCLFSDLHALEVELWIHCFCTRLRLFRSSVVTRLTPEVLLEPVFLPQHFTLTFKKNNQHLKLTDGSLESG